MVPALTNTGSPAVAWISALRKERCPCRWCERTGTLTIEGQGMRCPACDGAGDQLLLKADFTDLHPHVADHIEARSYRRVSSEIYDNPRPFGVPTTGKMLRRVALLGGELPRIKTLADLPAPTGDRRSLYGVEIFAAGRHPAAGGGPGKEYSEDDLNDIVSNFRRFSIGDRALIRSPVVIGHEETQPLSQFSDGAACLLITGTRLTSAGSWEVFCERVTAPDADLYRAERFCEQHAADLARCGFTRTDFLTTYRNLSPEQRRTILPR